MARQMRPESAFIFGDGVKILEQNYDYAGVNYMNMLSAFVGKEVKTVRTNPATGENIYENVTDIVEKSGEFQETHAELLDKLAETTGAAKDKIAETTGTAKNKITGTTETAREKIAETTGNAKEKITDTAANAKLAISENIMEAKSSFEAKKNAWTEKSEEWKKNREKQKAELSELSEKYEHLFEEKNFGFQRLMKAFPDMKSRENDKTLTEFKKHFRLDKPEQK